MISENLIKLRKQHSLTMREIADKIGVSLSAYQKYENGTRDVSTEMLCKIAALFHVTADYLLGLETGEPDPAQQLANEFNMSALEKKILDNYLSLPKAMRGDLMEFLQKAVREVQEESN